MTAISKESPHNGPQFTISQVLEERNEINILSVIDVHYVLVSALIPQSVSVTVNFESGESLIPEPPAGHAPSPTDGVRHSDSSQASLAGLQLLAILGSAELEDFKTAASVTVPRLFAVSRHSYHDDRYTGISLSDSDIIMT